MSSPSTRVAVAHAGLGQVQLHVAGGVPVTVEGGGDGAGLFVAGGEEERGGAAVALHADGVETGFGVGGLVGAVRRLLIRSVRHFAEMTEAETAAFGPLVAKPDAAIHATVDAERVHLVSTRDRVQHFHAWLYPRAAGAAPRGTDFLAGPQTGAAEDTDRVAALIRERLAGAVRPGDCR